MGRPWSPFSVLGRAGRRAGGSPSGAGRRGVASDRVPVVERPSEVVPSSVPDFSVPRVGLLSLRDDARFRHLHPSKGASGALRKYAYRKYSEGRAAQWLVLIVADRFDAWESHLRSFTTLRPDNPVTETGVLSESSFHGIPPA